jgi:prepilin-type N-terminal cleavage/methylation domain-containing protein
MTEVGAAAPGGSSAPSGRGRRDHGFSVIEVVVSVLIMGIIAVPLLDSLWGAVRASSSANETAMVQTALQDAADRVNRAPLSCSYASYAQAAALALGWSSATVTTTHRRYVPGANPTVAGTWSAGACAGAQPDPGTLQMVVVTVRSPRLGVTRSVEVFKSGF